MPTEKTAFNPIFWGCYIMANGGKPLLDGTLKIFAYELVEKMLTILLIALTAE